jgi:hypothetical protein
MRDEPKNPGPRTPPIWTVEDEEALTGQGNQDIGPTKDDKKIDDELENPQ